MAKISVIFPTFNRHVWLKQALATILAQKNCDFECVVLDHGSTPETDLVLKSFYDSRLKALRIDKNRAEGAREVWALLGERATGEYIVFFSDDDLMLPFCLDQKSDLLDAHPECGFAFSSADLIDLDGKLIGNCRFNIPTNANMFDATPFSKLFVGNQICMPTVMFRREYLSIWETLTFGPLNDWAFWLEIANKSKSIFIQQPTIQYRIHEQSDSKITGAREFGFLKHYPLIWRHWMERGHKPSLSNYQQMMQNMALLGKQQIDMLRDDFK